MKKHWEVWAFLNPNSAGLKKVHLLLKTNENQTSEKMFRKGTVKTAAATQAMPAQNTPVKAAPTICLLTADFSLCAGS